MTRFDEPWCVRLQHEGGDRVYEETKDLSPEELAAWWEERNAELRRLIEERRAARKPASALP